jgi:hypothetical protein
MISLTRRSAVACSTMVRNRGSRSRAHGSAVTVRCRPAASKSGSISSGACQPGIRVPRGGSVAHGAAEKSWAGRSGRMSPAASVTIVRVNWLPGRPLSVRPVDRPRAR